MQMGQDAYMQSEKLKGFALNVGKLDLNLDL